MSKYHKVKRHHWENGVLQTTEHYFETLEEAIGFASSTTGDSIKVYDDQDQLIQQVTPQAINTYA
jgi:hypothetical protein